MSEIREEIDVFIKELEKKGVSVASDLTGLGDLVEYTLTSLGITQERYKEWFGLEECYCTQRKKMLNNLLSWKRWDQ